MVKRIVLLFAVLWASLAFAQGGYVVSYTSGLTDLTAQATSGTNVWHQLSPVGTCVDQGLGVGYDGYVLCANSTGTYSYNATNHSWDATGMGVWQGVAVEDQSDIYVLGPNGLDWALCQSRGLGEQSILFWNGTAFTAKHGCATKISVANDGTLAASTPYGGNTAYKSTDGGSTWTQITGTGWTQYTTAGASTYCGVKGGLLYTQTGTMTTPAAFSPSPGTVAGCVINDSDPLLMVWTSAGAVKLYNYTNDTWGTVAGLSVRGLTSETKAKTLALDSLNHVYHFNVYAEYMSATLSGSYNNCPTPAQPCNPGVTHTGTAQITLPGGIYGASNNQTVAPNVNMNVNSFDASPGCDAFFGDECDPGSVVVGVLCNQSQHQLNVTGTGGAPNPPQKPHYQISENYKKWDGTRQIISSFAWKGTGWMSTAKCGTTISACTIGTVPYCDESAVNFTEAAKPSSAAVQDTSALLDCTKGPFAITAVYYPGQPNSCVLVTVDKKAKTPQNCF